MDAQNSTYHNGTTQGIAMQPYRSLTPRAHAELEMRATLLTGTKHTAEATRLVEEGRVERRPDDPEQWEVTGRSSGEVYTIRRNACRCRTKRDAQDTYACAHLAAIYLYKRVEEEMQKEGQAMFADDVVEPLTEELPQETPQNAPGSTNGLKDEDTGVPPSPGLLEAPRATNALGALPPVLPVMPSDLTPVALPGGGERTRSMGQLMQALARAQQHMKNPALDKQGQVGNLKTRFASTPAMRNEIVPALAAVEIGLLQYVYATEQGLRCMTTLGHSSGEYVCLPLDVPLSGTSLTERGKSIGFVKRWALATTIVLFGEDEAEGMEDLRPESRVVPDMTAPAPTRKTAAALRQEIEALATKQQRGVPALWAAAEKRFGRPPAELSVEQLEQMVRGLTDKGAA